MSTTQLNDTVTDYGTREAWLEARKSGIGASESAALFGIHPWTSRLALWLEKSGKVERDQPQGEQAERMEWGRVLETPIAEVYQRRTGRVLWQFSEFSIARHRRLGCMFATPDRFIIEAKDRQGDGNLQIKNTADVEGWAAGAPMYVQCQVQHELAVTGRDYAAIAVLVTGNRLLTWDVDRNDAFIAELEEQCRLFWESIEAGEVPPVDGHKASMAALKRLHRQDNGKEVELPAEAAAWWAQLTEAKQTIREAEAIRDLADAQLRAAMGDNTFGRLPGGMRLSLKTAANPGYTTVVPPYTYRTLREDSVAKRHAAKRKKAA
jgi:putative phage-type endonuclease